MSLLPSGATPPRTPTHDTDMTPMLRTPRLLLALLLATAPALAVDPIRAPAPLDAPPANATETASGMAFVVLKPAPAPQRTVGPTFVQYLADGWSADGVTRANSRQEGPQVASIRRLAVEQPGLARALMSTPVGETRRWWIQPERLKPGYAGMPDLPHVFDLTVLGEVDPVAAPADVAAPPADAIRTGSGLAYKVIKAGPGGDKPGADSTIVIHYTGWTADGRVFDSSVLRDQQAIFPLAQLIPGWQEGVRLMSPGDTYRFWIPGNLAYDSDPNPQSPKGMLVFDVTLFGFEG